MTSVCSDSGDDGSQFLCIEFDDGFPPGVLPYPSDMGKFFSTHFCLKKKLSSKFKFYFIGIPMVYDDSSKLAAVGGFQRLRVIKIIFS